MIIPNIAKSNGLTHKGHSAQHSHPSTSGRAPVSDPSGLPEVSQLYDVLLGHEKILRLNVSMDEAVEVQKGDGPRAVKTGLQTHVGCPLGVVTLQLRLQVASFTEFYHLKRIDDNIS
jgi:hypothetical protein